MELFRDAKPSPAGNRIKSERGWKTVSWKKIMAPFDMYELSRARAWLMGVATLLVTFYHSQYLDLFSSSFLTQTRLLSLVTRVHKTGNSGVDLFVLLSGFGLFFSYARLKEKQAHPARAFYQRRYGKVLPTVLTVTVLTYGLLGTDSVSDWFGKVLLYGTYLPGRAGGNFWYFSCLMGLYLIYPLVHRIIQGKHGLGGAAALAAVSVGVAMILRAVCPDYYYGRADLMLTRFPAFVAGAYLGKMSLQHRKIPALIPAAAAPLSVILLVLVADSPDSFYDYRFYTYCLLVLSMALSHAWILSKIPGRHFLFRSVCMIGSFSMEIYLIYETVYYHSQAVLNTPDPAGLIYAGSVFAITLLLAALLRMTMDKIAGVYAAGRKARRFILWSILLFLEELSLRDWRSFSHAAVVAFAAPALTGEHLLGTFLILGKLHMFLDGKRLGHLLHIKIVGTNQREGPVLFLQLLDKGTYHLQRPFL